MSYDERLAARVRALLSTRDHVVEKKMVGGLCFMVNGAAAARGSSPKVLHEPREFR